MAWALNGLCIWCSRTKSCHIYIEEFQFNWIRGKKSGFLERPITISWYCWQTKNHQALHRVKPPSKAIQVSKSMSHGSKWDRPNSIHCCYVSQIHTNTTYSRYIRGGNIFHHILDVLIPLKNWPWIFHGTTNILNFEEKISWTTLTSSLQRVGKRHSRNGRRVALVQNSDRISA